MVRSHFPQRTWFRRHVKFHGIVGKVPFPSSEHWRLLEICACSIVHTHSFQHFRCIRMKGKNCEIANPCAVYRCSKWLAHDFSGNAFCLPSNKQSLQLLLLTYRGHCCLVHFELAYISNDELTAYLNMAGKHFCQTRLKTFLHCLFWSKSMLDK